MTTRVLLSTNAMLDIVSILLATFCLPYCHRYSVDSRRLPESVLMALGAPAILVLMVMLGIAAAIVVGALKTSLGAAVAIGVILISRIILCLLFSGSRARGRM